MTPIVGPLIVTAAAFGGSGALVLHAWRAVRSDDGSSTAPAPAAADATS